MRRWSFHLLAALSLLLFIATGVLWYRGCWVAREEVDRREENYPTATTRTYALISFDGVLCLYVIRSTYLDPGVRDWYFDPPDRLPLPRVIWGYGAKDRKGLASSPTLWKHLGFHLQTDRSMSLPGRSDEVWRTVVVPDWFIMLVAIPGPLMALRRWRLRVRGRKEGRCLVCGYDLRASPDRCPECGSIPA